MIRAFIFDMDGTLVDTEILWIEATAGFLRERGIEVSLDELTMLVYGHSGRNILGQLSKRFPQLDLSYEEMTAATRPRFFALREEREIAIHSSVELLKSLAQHYPVCIVSSSGRRYIAYSVERLALEPYLSFYLGGDEYRPHKPDPTCYQLAGQKLGVEPAECVVFEDSLAGVTAAKEAGMYCVALVRKDRPAQDVSAADVVLDDLGRFSLAQFAREMGEDAATLRA